MKNPQAEWPHVSVTYAHRPGTFGLSDSAWRYIRYTDGGEELYDIEADPYEWTNLAGKEAHAKKLAELRAKAPKKFAPLVKAKDESLPALKARRGNAPASKPDGNTFDVVFINQRQGAVELFWIDREGNPKSYGEIAAGTKRRQQTRPGAVRQAKSTEGEPAAVHFIVDDRPARAVVQRRK